MANTIKIKRGSGSDPAASDMVLGEPVLRTDTAELFFKKDDGSVAKVSGGGGGPDFKYLELRNAANNGAASYPNADFTLVTSGTTTAITPAAANTLLVSVNGVIQKPNTGTSTPSSGFALNGSTIKFGGNLSAAPDFILYQESGGIGEPSNETVSEAKLKVSNNPINGYFLSAQSGNTGGLTWAAPVATSCTGNSATATALATARTINGTSFDGTANITVTAAAGTLTGNTLNSSVTASSLTSLGDLNSLTVTGDMAVDTNTLFVNSSNNRVGIGTTSPGSLLNIRSALPEFRISSSDTSHGTGDEVGRISIYTQDSTTPGAGEVFRVKTESASSIGADYTTRLTNRTGAGGGQTEVSLGNGEGSIYFATNTTGNNASVRMAVKSSGRVGIGTTSPDQKLVVADTSSVSLIRVTANNAQEAGIDFGDTDDNDIGRIRYGNNGNYMRFFVNAAERLRITSGGNLGLGLTNPQRLFTQHQNSSGSNYHQFTNTTTGTTSADGLLVGITNNEEAIIWNYENTDLRFATNNTDRMRILSNGRIGFATNSTTGLGSQTGAANVCTFNFAGVTLTQYSVTAGFYYDRLNFTNSQYFIVNSSGTGVYLGNGSTSFTAHSDERLKENITELDSVKAYNHVKTARAASFKWKATGYPTDTKIGFIAQDWETNYPEVTNSTTETIDEVENPKGIQYTETIPVLMAALKQAIAKIETLETKVAALEAN